MLNRLKQSVGVGQQQAQQQQQQPHRNAAGIRGGAGAVPPAQQAPPQPSREARLEALADGLGKEFYESSFDPVRKVLAALPGDEDAMEAYLASTKAEQQDLLDAVSARLGKEVMANYQAFIDGMRQISEIDMDVSRAGIHVSNSLRKLGSAKESLVLGTLGITYRRRRRERLFETKGRLSWLRALVKVEEEVARCVGDAAFAEAVGVVVEAQSRLRDPSTKRFVVVGNGSSLRGRIDSALTGLRDRVDRAMDTLCIRFDPQLYGGLLLAYRDLDEVGVPSSRAAAAAAAAAGNSSSSARVRAGTFMDEGEEQHLPGDEPLSAAGSSSSSAAGRSLLAEVGTSLAVGAAAANAGVLAIPGIAGPDSNLAALASRVDAAALKAIKSVTKDVVIDLLLKDLRAKVDAEEAAAEKRRRHGGGSSDEDDEDRDRSRGNSGAVGGGDDLDGIVKELEGLTAPGSVSAASAAAAQALPASFAADYAAKRAEMRLRPFGDLAGSLPTEDIPEAALRVCAGLVHVMHSHYLLLQWHRAPLDPRNNFEECEFLHRCGMDDEDDMGEGGAPNEGGVVSGAHSASRPSPSGGGEEEDPAHAAAALKAGASRLAGKAGVRVAVDAPAFLSLLRALRPFLLRGRSTIWQHMQQRLASLLFSAVGAAGAAVPAERLAQCLIIARDFMSVGLEYVGFGRSSTGSGGGSGSGVGASGGGPLSGSHPDDSAFGSGGGAAGGLPNGTAPSGNGGGAASSVDSDPCSTLRGSLRLLCSQHMDTIHGECVDKLRGMLGKELWVRVPVTEAVMGSIMSEALAGVRQRFSKAAALAIGSANAALKGMDGAALMYDRDGGNGSGNGGRGGATGGGRGAALDLGGGGGGYGTSLHARTYSDGASLFSTWIDRGNPFGWVRFEIGPRGSGSGAGAGAAAARAGVTVLPTPRLPPFDEDDDEEEDEGEEEEVVDAATAARRAVAKHLRRVHGDGYTLELGLGRGPGFGFTTGGGGGGAGGAAAGGRGRGPGDDSDADGDGDDDLVEEEDALDSSEDEDVDDDDIASGKRRPRKGRGKYAAEGDAAFAAGGGPGPFAAAFGGGHQHVVTAAALNGFARTVGKYLLLMEMLPSMATDAFTGLARLFELYLYTVGSLFIRARALRQLYDIGPPVASSVDRDKDPNAFDYVDGSAYTVAARVAAMAEEARAADHKQSGGSRIRRLVSGGGGAASATSGGDDDDALSSSSSSFSSARRGRGGGGVGSGDPKEEETVTLYGTPMYLRGLRAMAVAQGLSPDYYTANDSPGATAGNLLVGSSFSSEAVYITLRRTLQQIGAELASGVRMGTGSAPVLAEGVITHDTGASMRGYMPEPFVRLQASVEIDGEAAAHGISERCVAAESLDFLLDVLSRVRGRVEAHLPATHAASVATFYARASLVCTQLRALVYNCVVPLMLPESGAIPSMVASVKWDLVKDAMEISPYVGAITAPLQRVANTLKEKVAAGTLPAVSHLGLWSCVLSHVMERFVEGFSRVRKCSVPGRGLMTLDVGHTYAYATRAGPTLSTVLARDKAFVDAYVSAFYLESEADLLQWISTARAAYALRHMRAIVLYGPVATSKRKQLREIQNAVDALYLLPPDMPVSGGGVLGNAMSTLV